MRAFGNLILFKISSWVCLCQGSEHGPVRPTVPSYHTTTATTTTTTTDSTPRETTPVDYPYSCYIPFRAATQVEYFCCHHLTNYL